ncbi:MAG: hypothetical protein QM677_01935 [Microbacterium sp.]
MRLASIFSEAIRNLLTGTSKAGLFALVLAIIGVALAAIDLTAITGQQARARVFDGAGASIRVLAVEQGVDPVACDALTLNPAITASGALASATAITLSAAPRNPITAYTATTGLAAVLGVTSQADGVWISEDLATTLGVRTGSVLPTTTGLLTIAGTYAWPDDGRDARLAYAIISPTPTNGDFSECWARTWPLTTAADDLIRAAAVSTAGSGEALNIAQLNNSYGAVYDAYADYQNRATRYAWVGTAVAAFVLGFTAARRRRLEYASALHAGQSRTAQIAGVAIETLTWAGVAAILSIGATHALAAWFATDDAILLAEIQLTGPLTAIVTATVGAVIGAALTRETHLFRYFKERN